MPNRNRPLNPWEIAARRRNARKSTGPRTPAGKRRAAFNSLRVGLCSRSRKETMLSLGEEPRQFLRIRRDLTSLFEPEDTLLDELIEELAEDWWDKALRVQNRRRPFEYDLTIWACNREIDEKLEALVEAFRYRYRKWYCRLIKILGSPIDSWTDLRITIERQMGAFRRIANGPPERPTSPPQKGFNGLFFSERSHICC